MCDCYKIGGPWIAEDPNCPVHGRKAQERERHFEKMCQEALSADSVEELRSIVCEIITIVRDIK